jgi:hypothetical protein
VTRDAADADRVEAAPVIEYLVRSRNTWGTRVYEDGTAEELTDEQSGWQPLVHLPLDEVTSLIDSAYEDGFFDLPSTIAPEVEADGGTAVEWTLERGGRRHNVKASGEAPALLRALNDRLQLAVGRALNREADAGSAAT